MAHQHVAARGSELWTIFLEARQDGKIALIQQLSAEICEAVISSACAGTMDEPTAR
jgi:hypothetical protein